MQEAVFRLYYYPRNQRSWGRTSGLLISYQTQTKSQVCKIGYNLLGCHHHSHSRAESRAEIGHQLCILWLLRSQPFFCPV